MEQYKQFFFKCVASSMLIVGLLISINCSIDLYGLFWRDGKKGISVYSDERTSKYLLAYKYVPLNFEAYILGPSLSANLNTKEITQYKIYNLSMMGANITEQKEVLEKTLERSTPKFVIICLHPYLTADHGMKTGMINSREYYGALGSVSLYKAYLLKVIRNFDLMPEKYPKNQFNDYGYNYYNKILQTVNVEERIKTELDQEDAVRTEIDSIAMAEFDEVINTLHIKGVKIIAYFHPLPRPIYDKFKLKLLTYQNIMGEHLDKKATVIDLNSPAYTSFTSDYTNYIDHGHLSERGQQFVLREVMTEAGMIQLD